MREKEENEKLKFEFMENILFLNFLA